MHGEPDQAPRHRRAVPVSWRTKKKIKIKACREVQHVRQRRAMRLCSTHSNGRTKREGGYREKITPKKSHLFNRNKKTPNSTDSPLCALGPFLYAHSTRHAKAIQSRY